MVPGSHAHLPMASGFSIGVSHSVCKALLAWPTGIPSPPPMVPLIFFTQRMQGKALLELFSLLPAGGVFSVSGESRRMPPNSVTAVQVSGPDSQLLLLQYASSLH